MITIPLTQGKSAVIDDRDADLAAFEWSAHRPPHSRTWYAVRAVRQTDGTRKIERLHRAVWIRAHPGEDAPREIDHRDGDGLNCARENLRAAVHCENSRNQRRHRDNASGFKGVSWSKQKKRWRAEIMSGGARRHLGLFGDPEVAARAYDAAARELHREFAALNFPRAGECAAAVTGVA
jgi:hypothetical protein